MRLCRDFSKIPPSLADAAARDRAPSAKALAYLDVPTLGKPEVFLQHKPGFFAPDGSTASEDTKQFLQEFMDRYVDWVRHHADRIANR